MSISLAILIIIIMYFINIVLVKKEIGIEANNEKHFLSRKKDFQIKYVSKRSIKITDLLIKVLYFMLCISILVLIVILWEDLMVYLYNIKEAPYKNVYKYSVGVDKLFWYVSGLFIGISYSITITNLFLKSKVLGRFDINLVSLGSLKAQKITFIVVYSGIIIYTYFFMNCGLYFTDNEIFRNNPLAFNKTIYENKTINYLYKIHSYDGNNEVITYEIIFNNNDFITSKSQYSDDNNNYDKIFQFLSYKTGKKLLEVSVDTNQFQSILDIKDRIKKLYK